MHQDSLPASEGAEFPLCQLSVGSLRVALQGPSAPWWLSRSSPPRSCCSELPAKRGIRTCLERCLPTPISSKPGCRPAWLFPLLCLLFFVLFCFAAALLRIPQRARMPRASLCASLRASLRAVVATLDFLNYVCQEGDRKFESHLQQLCHAYYQAQMT